MISNIEQLLEAGTAMAKDCGLNFSLRILGEGARRSLIVNDQAVISRDAGTDSWTVRVYPVSLSMIQLSAMFGVDLGDTLPSTLIPADTAIDALRKAFSALFRSYVNSFVERHNQEKQEGAFEVVAKIPEKASRIEDGVVLRDRALALCGISLFDSLPAGVQRWLNSFDWKGARAVFNLKSTYRLSIENGRIFHSCGDHYRYSGSLAQPYDRTDKIHIPAYSRGVAIFECGRYELFFFTLGAIPKVYQIRVKEEDMAKNFRFELDDSASVGVTVSSVCGCYVKEATRKVRLSRLMETEATPFASGVLSRDCLQTFNKSDNVAMLADVEGTALNPSTRLFFGRFSGVRYFANIDVLRSSLTPESTEIVVSRCDAENTVNVNIPIEVRPPERERGRYSVVSADPSFVPLLEAMDLGFHLKKVEQPTLSESGVSS